MLPGIPLHHKKFDTVTCNHWDLIPGIVLSLLDNQLEFVPLLLLLLSTFAKSMLILSLFPVV